MSCFQESSSDGNKGLKQNGWTSATPEGVAVSLNPFAASSPHKWSVLTNILECTNLADLANLPLYQLYPQDQAQHLPVLKQEQVDWRKWNQWAPPTCGASQLFASNFEWGPLPPAQRVMIFHFARVHLYYLCQLGTSMRMEVIFMSSLIQKPLWLQRTITLRFVLLALHWKGIYIDRKPLMPFVRESPNLSRFVSDVINVNPNTLEHSKAVLGIGFLGSRKGLKKQVMEMFC